MTKLNRFIFDQLMKDPEVSDEFKKGLEDYIQIEEAERIMNGGDED